MIDDLDLSRTPAWPRFRVMLGSHPRFGIVALAATRIGRQKFGTWVPRLPGAPIGGAVCTAHRQLSKLMEGQVAS